MRNCKKKQLNKICVVQFLKNYKLWLQNDLSDSPTLNLQIVKFVFNNILSSVTNSSKCLVLRTAAIFNWNYKQKKTFILSLQTSKRMLLPGKSRDGKSISAINTQLARLPSVFYLGRLFGTACHQKACSSSSSRGNHSPYYSGCGARTAAICGAISAERATVVFEGM